MKKVYSLIYLLCLVSTIATSQNNSELQLVSSEAVSGIDKNQLCKKWYVVDSTFKNNLPDNQKGIFEKSMKGSFIQFDLNNDYAVKMPGMNKKGKWEVSPDQENVISIEIDGNKSAYWTIIKMTETNLFLQANNGIDWTFSTKKL